MLVLSASAARAEVVVNEVETSWQGCVYRLKVVDPHGTPNKPRPTPRYNTYLERDSVSPGSCALEPTSILLNSDPSEDQSEIAIAAHEEGLVIAWTWGGWNPFIGYARTLHLRRLDMTTLYTRRNTQLNAIVEKPDGTPQSSGRVYLSGLTLTTDSVELTGTLRGNHLFAGSLASARGEGGHFTALYPDFFRSTQPPLLAIQ
ncbi:MAG: hypothetical protein ABW123_16895 [Cystobacter sp.]